MPNFKQRHSLPLLYLISALLASCTSGSRLAQENSYYRENPLSLFRDALQHSQKLNTLEGSGYLSVESPQGGFTGTARVYYQNPDSLLVQIKTGPGVSVGYMLVTGKQFQLYNIPDRTLFRSEGDQAPLEELIGVRLQLPNIFDAALGVPRLQGPFNSHDSEIDSLQFDFENDNIRYYLESGGDSYLYQADPKEGVFVGYTLVRSGEVDSIFCVYKQFRKQGGIKIPRHIQITRPAQKERISFFYTRLKVNGKMSKNRFSPKTPGNVKVIDLNQ